ncbi:MAG: HDOD domain-containing protein [Candidatus Nitricoxidivorans perseverans]|uniref:HDOD domain-containing protein n=1 Tax=Candidatus Nitricoxidivorans perseverans TaxID=2975601 RepID=A0AA49FJ38_9PROT|nr:MAG: HDOD domain-containing protein [Candidatus Nitricoxidivorans perseverans]
MSTGAFIRREPVVNRHKAITASRLIVHAALSTEAASALGQVADVWPTANSIFVGLAGGLLDDWLLTWQPPENVMVELPAAAIEVPSTQMLIGRLHAAGIPMCLDGWIPGMTLPAGLQFRFVLADARAHPVVKNAPGLPLAKGLSNHEEFDRAVDGGYAGAAGWFFLNGMPVADKLSPAHAQIVRVLNLVRHNAEIRDVEAALKQDVALSYKLLRYINSAGFGLSCEIQSFRHAVTILGYDKLNKWLSLLLVTASRDPAAPALMQTAIARGRFMELAGQRYFDRAQVDNLFITGAFSLLNVLLGTRLEVVLDQMHLPEAIADALLRREGIYAPFLDLALACENGDMSAFAAKTEALQLTAAQVNHAQVEALAFADSLQFS